MEGCPEHQLTTAHTQKAKNLAASSVPHTSYGIPLRRLMDTLTIELTAALVDNYATANSQTKVETSLLNNSGWLTVEDLPGVPRSRHRFVIHNAVDVGCPPLDAEQASFIFATACSLITPRILFSPLQPQRFAPNLRLGEIPSNVEVTETPSCKNIDINERTYLTDLSRNLIRTKVKMDAGKLLDIINQLLKVRPFDFTGRPVNQLNVLDGLKRYQEALLAGEPLACYKALFTSLEKIVNLSAEKKGAAFDAAASAASGLSQTAIKDIRDFNNRVKHMIRHKEDFEVLRRGESNLSILAKNLKVATDNVLLARI